MGFGEYAALYLMTWSNVWWAPTRNPTPLQAKVRAAIVDRAPSDPLFFLEDYTRATRATRQLLANIPTYMMYDDHDVANNWPLSEAYEKTRQSKVGRWVVGNAMLANLSDIRADTTIPESTYALFQMGGHHWEEWRKSLDKAVVETQESDKSKQNLFGSWSPDNDCWGEDGGRVYTTAILALTLQAYNRYTRLLR